MSAGTDAAIEARMTVYASLLAQRDAHDANRRMVDLYALGGIGYYGGERVISRRYHLSDELDLTLRILAVLRKRVWSGDEKGLAEQKRLTARADELREQLGLPRSHAGQIRPPLVSPLYYLPEIDPVTRTATGGVKTAREVRQ